MQLSYRVNVCPEAREFGLRLNRERCVQAGRDIRSNLAWHHQQNQRERVGELRFLPHVSPFGLLSDADALNVFTQYMRLLHGMYVPVLPVYSQYYYIALGDDGKVYVDKRSSHPQSHSSFANTVNSAVQRIASVQRSVFDRDANNVRYEHLYGRVSQYHRVCMKQVRSFRQEGSTEPVNYRQIMRREIGLNAFRRGRRMSFL